MQQQRPHPAAMESTTEDRYKFRDESPADILPLVNGGHAATHLSRRRRRRRRRRRCRQFLPALVAISIASSPGSGHALLSESSVRAAVPTGCDHRAPMGWPNFPEATFTYGRHDGSFRRRGGGKRGYGTAPRLAAVDGSDADGGGGDSSSKADDGLRIDQDDLFLERFRRRRQESRFRRTVRHELLPPNPALTDPCDFVSAILNVLRRCDDGAEDSDDYYSGTRVLYRSSTPEWRGVIRRSIGAPAHAGEASVASALRSAISRTSNQFNILLGGTTADAGGGADEKANEYTEYTISFPNDPVDYDDGVCWLECRLRGSRDDDLLAVTGWTLHKRSEDGALLVHKIDWQDFRDGFRPGIGREEWERICG